MDDLIEYDPECPPLPEITGELDFSGDFIDEDRWECGYDY